MNFFREHFVIEISESSLGALLALQDVEAANQAPWLPLNGLVWLYSYLAEMIQVHYIFNCFSLLYLLDWLNKLISKFLEVSPAPMHPAASKHLS